MQFVLNDDQRLLKESVARVLRESYNFEIRQRIVSSEAGHSSEIWAKFAELGWLSLPFAEEDGGHGLGPTDLMVLLEEFGHHLVTEPYIPAVIVAGGILRRARTERAREEFRALIEGKTLTSLAYEEPGMRYDLNVAGTWARKMGQEYVLDGAKVRVPFAASAGQLIVTARLETGEGRNGEVGLFLVPADAPGVEQRHYRLLDASRASDVRFEGVHVPPTARLLPLTGGVDDVIADVMDDARAAQCAMGVGAMQALVNLTNAYLHTRVQFGQPLFKFQALQHRLADMVIGLERSRAITWMAMHANNGDAVARTRWVSAAKAEVARSGRMVGQNAIQLHGGIGISDELSVSHYFKLLMTIEFALGDRDYHLARIAETERLTEVAVGL